MKAKYTYEQSVRWMRAQPEHAKLVEQCYLDENNLVAAKRFASSEEFAALISLLGSRIRTESLEIMDLGCGNGIASYAFAAMGHRVTAVDPDLSDDVGLGATARLSPEVANEISTIRAFAETLPFNNASFDVVYARQCLHHFQNLRQGLAECARVLKPNGTFLATREHVIDNDEQLKEFLASHPLHALHGGEHAYQLTEYLSALESAGLRIVYSFGPYDTVINHYPESNQDVTNRIYDSLKQRYGPLASVLLRLREKRYRRRMSEGSRMPGRPYSFLCIKE